MTGIATHTTNYVRGEVSLFRAVVFAVTNLTAILTSLVLIVTESTVESSKLTKLVALELVLAFWNGCSLYGILVYESQQDVGSRYLQFQ
jgi:hypothetical protein